MEYGEEGKGVHVPIAWHPIDTAPNDRRVLLWLDEGEKGNGEIAVGIVFRENLDDPTSKVVGYWTWGWANSGSDVYERPTHWAWLPLTPEGGIHG